MKVVQAVRQVRKVRVVVLLVRQRGVVQHLVLLLLVLLVHGLVDVAGRVVKVGRRRRILGRGVSAPDCGHLLMM